MEIKGDIRTYLVVNTTEYNGDTEWSVRDCRFDELPEWGFNDLDIKQISELEVGGVASRFDEHEVLVIRVA